MNEPHDLNKTVDEVPSAPSDSLDAGLAADFGKAAQTPRSSLDASQRPVLLREAQGESDHVVKPHSDAMPDRATTGDRYQLFGEIARGGMGAVLRGRDVDLGRDLAVKVLLEKHADNPAVARRFLEEAQIGGQLQHPGVVPVYDVGHFGERPFFTMKLVKGKTLAAILGERADASADRPRLLGIALQVTQALAYAHDKGVIHRDLKPANVIVGAFGEVQVIDWGLAKVLAEGGVADEEKASRQHQEEGTLIRTARSSGSAGSFGTETEAGSLLGTPAYMPPEQANGDVASLDRRADVFGLGAILCEILTGKPPYVGRSSEEVRRKAANGDLAAATARLDACGADAELIVLTKACLSPEAIDRPRDAQAVADGLAAYLGGIQERLQAAERERAVAVAREAEQRKRRKVQLALAAAVGLLLLGGGAAGWWQSEQAAGRLLAEEQAAAERAQRQFEDERREAAEAARLGRNAEAVAALLGRCEEALKAENVAKAAVALEAAKKRATEGGAEKEADRLGRLAADLVLLRELDEIDQFRWTWGEKQFPDPTVVATRTRAALGRFGADPGPDSVDEAAARVAASAVRDRIVAALNQMLRQPKAAGLRALLRRVDVDPYRDAVRDALLARDRARIVELAENDAALEQPSGFAAMLGDCPEIGAKRKRQLLHAALIRRPGDVGLLLQIGHCSAIDRTAAADEKVRWHQAAVAAAPANFAAHINLGNSLAVNGRADEAITYFRRAIALDPKNPIGHNNLGFALATRGRADEAVACFRKAIALDPKHAGAYGSLGNLLVTRGRADEAVACFRKAIELEPKNAIAHTNLGNVLVTRGRADEALACFRKAIALDPKNPLPHYNLGNALRALGRLNDAVACWRKTIECDPTYAEAHCNLGGALRRRGRFAESLAALRRGHELGEKRPDWPYPSAAWVRQAEAEAAIEAKLPAFLEGEFQPADNDERLVLAAVCQARKLHHAAARLSAEAFAADPRLAGDPRQGFRYNAACSAALAATGQGEDAAKLGGTERSTLRRRALTWLRADLTAWTRLFASGDVGRSRVAQVLAYWQKDADLAGLRDKGALAKLSAEERAACERFWADVAALLKKADAKAK